MAKEEINKYITGAYYRLLDYSNYWCSQAGIPDDGVDVLNEVLLSTLQKSDEFLLYLLNRKKGKYCELDFYILKSIRLSATSPTSQYRHRYRGLPVDWNVDYTRLDIEDIKDEDHDRPGEVLEKMNKVREIVEGLNLSDYAKKVFMWRMSGEGWEDWPGDETNKELFDVFYKIRDMVCEKLNGKTIF